MKKILSMICALCLVLAVIIPASANTENESPSSLILGDSDLDSRVNVRDATLIQKHVAGILTLSANGQLTADVDGNGRINVKDATVIQKFVAGYSIAFPIGEPVDSEETDPSVPSSPDEAIPSSPDETIPSEPETVPSEPETVPSEPETVPSEPETVPSEPETVPPTEEDYSPTDTDLSDPVTAEVLWRIEKRFLELVNEEREKLGIAPLTHNKHLDDVAQLRSAEIILNYSHTRPNGELFHSLLDVNKYSYTKAGENIDMSSHILGFFNPATDKFTGSDKQIESSARILFEGFKASPGHYANMIDSEFIHNGIGVSYTYDAEWGIPYFYFVHIFGTDKS